jgi:hypothetical protein
MPLGYKIENSGRKAGTPNLITREMKEKLSELAIAQISAINTSTDIFEVRVSNEILRTILPYLMPRVMPEITEMHEPVIVQIHGNI